MNEAETVLLQAIRASLNGDETPDEIERVALAAVASVGLPEEVGQRLASLLNSPPEDPPMVATGPDAEGVVDRSDHVAATLRDAVPVSERPGHVAEPGEIPRLLVDWGTGLRIGWQVCAECQLVCPAEYASRPNVQIRVDRRLDQEDETAAPEVKQEEPGLWSFHVPFAMTTAGQDCRPGQYLVEISVVFPQVEPPKPRFFRCSVRLNVLDPAQAAGPTLEIEGEGQSMLNLQGRDLKSFARVVLRGRGTSVVNVQESLFGTDSPSPEPAASSETTSQDSEPLQFAYDLKIDARRNRQIPWFSPRFKQHQPTDTAALVASDGRRILLLARRKVKLGRSRDNDIVLRFLPRSASHDAWSRHISREHLSCRLSHEGLQISDLGSTKGSRLEGETLRRPRLLSSQDANDDIDLQLAADGKVEMPFRSRLRLIGPSDATRGHNDDDLDQALCGDVLGEPLPPLWQLAHSSRIDAVRIERMNNLSNQETYVLVYRLATLGHNEDAAIRFAEETLEAFHARLLHLGGCFWLQNLSAHGHTAINGHPLRDAETVPLTFGMAITLGSLELRYEPFAQTHL